MSRKPTAAVVISIPIQMSNFEDHNHLDGMLNITTSVLWYGARVTASFFPSGDQS